MTALNSRIALVTEASRGSRDRCCALYWMWRQNKDYGQSQKFGSPLPKTREFEQVIMIVVAVEEMAGSD